MFYFMLVNGNSKSKPSLRECGSYYLVKRWSIPYLKHSQIST